MVHPLKSTPVSWQVLLLSQPFASCHLIVDVEIVRYSIQARQVLYIPLLDRAYLSYPIFLTLGRVLHFSKRSEEHTSELQSRGHLVCRLVLEKKKQDVLPEQT